MAKIPGQKVLNGAMASLWFNGTQWLDVKVAEAKATINRESVQMCGSLDVDSKITSVEGEGSMTVHKVYTREADFVESIQSGKDVRFQLFLKIDDPDAYGKESVQIDDCWFNELTIAQFEAGAILEREFPFGYTFSNVKYSEKIDPR